MVNPFEKSDSLKSLSGTTCVIMDIATDPLKAENAGKKQVETFIAERVKSKNVSFYAPIKKNKLKSFAKLRVQKKGQIQKKLVTEERVTRYVLLVIIQRSL